MNTSNNDRVPVCYHTRIKEATKDSPEIHRFEARYTGCPVVFSVECERDKCGELEKEVQANPRAFGF
jgi:hypothetical protein